MNQTYKVERKQIEHVYRENYSSIYGEFLRTQSFFLSNLCIKNDSDLESGNIALFFEKNIHKNILREKDDDLDYDISFNNFWNNHLNINQDSLKIIQISNLTGLPKETTRRKIENLLKSKILKKDKKKLFWYPLDSEKQSYDLIFKEATNNISNKIKVFTNYLGYFFTLNQIKEEINKNYSFYRYHYLKFQLTYLKNFKEKLIDLELLQIFLECLIPANYYYEKNNIKFENHFVKTEPNFNIETPGVSSSTIAEITTIPRATCIRKLKILTKMKFLKKDLKSKKYKVDINSIRKKFSKKESMANEEMKIFSDFYLIIINALVKRI